MDRAAGMRPSGAATWVVCSGNIDMRLMFPDAPDEADSEVCEDGTACHWLASEVWEGRTPVEGSLSPNNRVIDSDMFDAVDMYHDVLRSWHGVAVVCEEYVPIPRIAPGFGGTPDAWAYNPDIKRLYIADLKYGFRFVEVWDNWQLICYAIGLLDLLRLDWHSTTVEFTIVQPRSNHRDGPVRKWVINAGVLFARATQLHAAANGPTMYLPNPGCGDCPGRHTCVAYQHAALVACERAYEGDPYELSPEALGNELRVLTDAASKLMGRISGLTVQATTLSAKGVNVAHFGLRRTFAREGWIEGGEAQVITLGKLMGVDVCKPLRAVTPNQARKSGLPSNIVAIYAHKPSTGMKLVKNDPYEAQKAFDRE